VQIVEPGYDGMSYGDSWDYFVWPSTRNASAPPNVFLGDGYSVGLVEPEFAERQDLHLISAWREGGYQAVEFTRLFDTKDAGALDVVLREDSSAPDAAVRMVWTTGIWPPVGAFNHTSDSIVNYRLSMHGFVGYTGMFRVNFAAGTVQEVTSGIQWPSMYWMSVVALCFSGAIGALLQTDRVSTSRLGFYMRSKPLLCPRKRAAASAPAPAGKIPAPAAAADDVIRPASPGSPAAAPKPEAVAVNMDLPAKDSKVSCTRRPYRLHGGRPGMISRILRVPVRCCLSSLLLLRKCVVRRTLAPCRRTGATC